MIEEQHTATQQPAASTAFVRVTRGALAFLSGSGMGLVAGLVMTILLTRTLGLNGYGLLSVALAVTTLIQTATTLGLPGGTSRMLALARGKDDEEGVARTFNASLLVGLISGTVGVAAIFLLSSTGLMDRIAVSTLLLITSPILVSAGIRSSLYGTLRAYQDVKALFAVSLVVPLFDVIVIGALVLLGVDEIGWYAGALVGAAYLEVGLLAYFVRKKRRFGSIFHTRWTDAKSLLSFSLPFILVQFMFLVVHQSDIVLLGAFHEAAVVGLYAPVMRLGQTVEKLLSAFPLLYMPIATAYFARNRIGEIHDLYLTVTKWAYALGFAVLLALFVTPGVVLPLLFGGAYESMVAESRVLAIGYWAALLTGLNGVTLGALGLQKKAAVAAFAGIVLNIAVAVFLIPRFAALGAAWSNTIAYLFANGAFSYILYRASGISPFRKDTTALYLYSFVVAGVGVAALALFDVSSTIAGLVLLAVVIVAWLGGAAFGKPFKMEWAEMKRVFTSSKKNRTDGDEKAGRERRAPFPIFVGRGRSGTTLFRAIFDAHPAVAVPPESPFLVSLAHRRFYFEKRGVFDTDCFLAELIAHPRFELWKMSEAEVRDAIVAAAPRTYADAIRALYGHYAARDGKTIYGDKSPRTTGAIPMLADLFPEARFIHIIRDGRDVALSHFDVDFGPDNVMHAALDWRREVGRCHADGSRLDAGRYVEVRYEDLIDRPEETVRGLCTFIGIEFESSMLRYFERADSVIGSTPTPDAHTNLRSAPKKVRDWRETMDEETAALFELFAGSLLTELGYEVTSPPLTVSARISARLKQTAIVATRRVHRMRNRELGKRVLHRLGLTGS
ncbi:MAG: sulfotransferase [Actinomycetota bacterium]